MMFFTRGAEGLERGNASHLYRDDDDVQFPGRTKAEKMRTDIKKLREIKAKTLRRVWVGADLFY